MSGYKCIYCGYGTLVKSNVKLTPDRKPYCRDEEQCKIRRNAPDEWEALRRVIKLQKDRAQRKIITIAFE